MGDRRSLSALLDPFERVVRNHDLLRLELAWASSNLAGRASAIAVAVYAYGAGGTTAVGVVAFARLAAAAAAAPWLSVLADRRSRRSVLIGTDLARAVVLGAMAALVAVGASSFFVYALAVLVALAEPLFRSAQAALTPSLVEAPQELTAANVVASGVESVGLFVGPALGALLLAAWSTSAVFAVTAGLAALAVALVVRIGVAGEPEEDAGSNRLVMLLAGWRTIVSEHDLRMVIGLFSAQTLVAGMFNVLVVALALELLGLGTAGVGLLAGVLGVGAVLAVVLTAGVAGRTRLAGYFGLGLLLWGIPLVLIAAGPKLALVVLLLLLVGVGNTLVDVTGVTLMQRSAPDAVLGRVFGAFEALVFLTMALGSLAASALADAFGTRGALLVTGLILPLVLLVFWRPLVAIDSRTTVSDPARIGLLRGVPIFEPLPARHLDRLARALVPATVEEGSFVFREGELGDRFYVIVDGEVDVEIGGHHQRRLRAGDFFGEIALLRGVPRTASVRAATELHLLSLDRRTFLATVSGHPASAEAAGSIVAARLPSPVMP